MKEYKGTSVLDAGLLAAGPERSSTTIFRRYGTLVPPGPRSWHERRGGASGRKCLPKRKSTDEALTKLAKEAVNHEAYAEAAESLPSRQAASSETAAAAASIRTELKITPPRCQRMQRKKSSMDQFLSDRWYHSSTTPTRLSEDDIQRAQLGPRGVHGRPDPARMTPQRRKKTPSHIDPAILRKNH